MGRITVALLVYKMALRRLFNTSLPFGYKHFGFGRRMYNSNKDWPPFDAADTYNRVTVPLPSVQRFLRSTLPQMGWSSGAKEEIVMDAGCASGMVTTEWLAPLFPSLKKIIAIDLSPDLIELANKHRPHPKVEYHVANLEHWSELKSWEGQLTKLISILCFHWLKNQPSALKNVRKLLQPGGEAAFFFPIESSFFTVLQTISRDAKWSQYFKNVDPSLPKPQISGNDGKYYAKLMEEMGFTINHMRECSVVDELPEDDYRHFFTSSCILVNYVPPDLRLEFTEELLKYLLIENDATDGDLPICGSIMLELVVQKKE